MLNFIATAVQRASDYPMPYTDTTPSTFNELAGNIFFALIVVFVAAIFLLFIIDAARKDRGLRESGLIFFSALACVLLVVLSVLGLALTAADAASNDARTDEKSRAAHDKSVIEWLESDYGITVDGAALSRLTNGATLVVDYGGEDTMIEFAERADRGLAIRIPDGRLLQPVGER